MIFLAICIAGFWLLALVADATFKYLMLSPYLRLLQDGMSVRPGCLQWHTTRWNRVFHRWRRWNPRFQDFWFALGSILSCSLVPVATLLLLKSLVTFFSVHTSSGVPSASDQILQPVLPGANVPLSDAAYYLLTLLFCSIVHEIGHALCAAREEVPVCGVGFFVMAIFPGAFVELSSEHVTNSSPCQRLRIFCAGVWHNLALVALSLALLWASPAVLSLGYTQGQGLIVLEVNQESGLAGPAGLNAGDIIQNVSDCQVKNISTWLNCIQRIDHRLPSGYCISERFLHDVHSTPIVTTDQHSCCSPNDASGLCFAFDDDQMSLRCLPVRKLLESNSGRCHSSKNCSELSLCAKPLLVNGSRLLQLQRLHKKPVLFLGSPHFLAHSVRLSPFIPKNSLWFPSLPYKMETQLRYLVAFSSALALLNVVPCYGLDGYHILSAFLDWLGIFNRTTQKRLLKVLTTAGTILLGTSIVCALYTLIPS